MEGYGGLWKVMEGHGRAHQPHRVLEGGRRVSLKESHLMAKGG